MLIDASLLQGQKNLLAFSAGVDSTALFFILRENNVEFDIAIVDYGVRVQAKMELNYARELAARYGIVCHEITAPSYDSHFEQNARDFRYSFFDTLVDKYEYENLITAHQLNDQLEWLLMRLCKGAGLCELLGLEETSERKNYTLIRPVLQYSRRELLGYLEEHEIKYYIDETNQDVLHERNRFRAEYSESMIEEFGGGIKNSFRYLKTDNDWLKKNFSEIKHIKELYILELHDKSSKTRAVDVTLKKLGYILSAAQRQEVRKQDSLVVGGKWAIELDNAMLYIAPHVKTDMTKQFKEMCRVGKVPTKIRPYMFVNDLSADDLL